MLTRVFCPSSFFSETFNVVFISLLQKTVQPNAAVKTAPRWNRVVLVVNDSEFKEENRKKDCSL